MLGFAPLGSVPLSALPSASGVDVTIALTGISVSTAQGTLTVIIATDLTLALTGHQVATSQGTLGVKNDIALVGQSAATAQGTLGLKSDKALTGQVAATAQGLLGVESGLGLTGQAATTAQGTLGLKSDIALSGQVSATSQGILGVDIVMGGDITLALTGVEVATSQGALALEIAVPLAGVAVATAQGTLTPVISIDITIALTSHSVTTSQGALTLATDCSLDYVHWGYVDVGYVCSDAVLMTAAQKISLEAIIRLHGLIAPLVVSTTGRGDGVVTQTLSGTSPVIVTTTANTSTGAVTGAMIDGLARWYGLIDPMVEQDASRSDGVLSQSVVTVGGITTITTL